MRKSLGVCLLVLLLTVPTIAGEIPNWTPAPPPAQPASAPQEPTDGVTLNGVMPNDAPDSLTQVTLELLAVLPSIF